MPDPDPVRVNFAVDPTTIRKKCSCWLGDPTATPGDTYARACCAVHGSKGEKDSMDQARLRLTNTPVGHAIRAAAEKCDGDETGTLEEKLLMQTHDLTPGEPCPGNNLCCNRPEWERMMFPCSLVNVLLAKNAELSRRIVAAGAVPEDVQKAAFRWEKEDYQGLDYHQSDADGEVMARWVISLSAIAADPIPTSKTGRELEESVSRVRAWLRDYGHTKQTIFVSDVNAVLDALADAKKLEPLISEARRFIASLDGHGTDELSLRLDVSFLDTALKLGLVRLAAGANAGGTT